MKVVILCGGKGTRLREETEYRPKPMVPVGGYPIVWHIMKIYAHYGHKEFVLCLGYKADMFKDYFRNYLWGNSDVTLSLGNNPSIDFHDKHDEQDWKITLANTGEDSMTAYRIKLIKKYIGDDETFLLTYGDGVSDINIQELIDFHHKTGKICTLSGVHPAGRFGTLGIHANIVSNFSEKPDMEQGYINGGYMVCNKKMFDYLPDDPNMMLERLPMEQLVKDGQLAVFQHEGFWQCMDTFAEYTFLNNWWNDGKATWKVW